MPPPQAPPPQPPPHPAQAPQLSVPPHPSEMLPHWPTWQVAGTHGGGAPPPVMVIPSGLQYAPSLLTVVPARPRRPVAAVPGGHSYWLGTMAEPPWRTPHQTGLVVVVNV